MFRNNNIYHYICGSYNKSLNGFGNLCMRNAGLLLGHRQTSLINIEATLVSRPVIAVDAGVE